MWSSHICKMLGNLCFFFFALCTTAKATKVDVVDIFPVYDYEFDLFDNLDKGVLLELFDSVAIDYSLTEVQLCNFQTDFQPTQKGGWGYVPLVCDRASNCLAPFPVGDWVNRTCILYEESRFGFAHDFACCPINATKTYSALADQTIDPALPSSHKYFEFKEVPTNYKLYTDSPYTALTGRSHEYVKDLGVREALSTSYSERVSKGEFCPTSTWFSCQRCLFSPLLRLPRELVCGFRKGNKLTEDLTNPEGHRDIYNRVPFFCVPPEKCINSFTDPVSKPHPKWHHFCENLINPRAEHEGKTVCCHADYIVEDFFGFNYIHLPQLPLYLKYAPGLRSSYKCEEYSKKVCVGTNDWCEKKDPILKYGQNPHMALLGFVVPKFMLFHCGGTLVSMRYILSTASCIFYFGYFTNVVLLGEYGTKDVKEIVKTEKTYIVSEITPYERSGFFLKPGEEPPTPFTTVDLALFRTDVEIDLSPYIRPACIYHSPLTWPDTLDFIGFGPRHNDEHKSDYLKTLELPFMNTSKCIDSTHFPDAVENPYYNKYGVHLDHLMCYGDYHKPHHAPCRYDTGGPLQVALQSPYCSTRLLGVLSSHRKDCTTYRPSVFVNVSLFIEQIEDVLWGNYTFLDIFDVDHEKPACNHFGDLLFFDKCPGGEECPQKL